MVETGQVRPDVRHGAALLLRATQDALGGVVGRPVSLAVQNRQMVSPTDLPLSEQNVIIELQVEYPAGAEHCIVVLADGGQLSSLCSLPTPDDEGTIAAEGLLNLGDIVSTFLDTLVHELDWLRPTPQASLTRLEPITADPTTGEFGLPPQLGGEAQLVVLSVVLTGDPGASCGLDVVFGKSTEEALVGMSNEGDSIPSGMAGPLDEAGMHNAANVVPMRPPQRDPGQQMPVDAVQPVQFSPLGPDRGSGARSGIDLIKDIPLHLSVELGRASLTVREILGLNVGSVVELDRLAGDPVDVLVNDRLIARGEVVVISESFGIRITEIIR